MKKPFPILVITLLLFARNVTAGVIVEEQSMREGGIGDSANNKVTLMLQGNQEKSVSDDGQTVIIDLDNDSTTVLNAKNHTYTIYSLSSKGTPSLASINPVQFKKSGEHKVIAGYSCEEYSGTGTTGGMPVASQGCFSTSAPGATEFSAFQKTMAQKVKGTAMGMMANAPEGIPLELHQTVKVKITTIIIPGMTRQEEERINSSIAKRPPLETNTIVSKVSVATLPTDTFRPPASYVKKTGPGTL
jgi:hypothetical protein